MAASRHWLVDGYNYLHRAGLLRRGAPDALERARRGLEARLRPLRARGDQITIVWDARGAPPDAPAESASAGGVRNVFVRGGATADADILARLRAADDPRRYCVVSDDREITGSARQLGAAIAGVRDVEARLGPARPRGRAAPAREDDDGEGEEEKPPPPRGDEVGDWLDYFGGEPLA